MVKITQQKTSFAAGEISPRMLGRGDLRAYENGAAKLRNVFVHPTGGLSRRAGLRYVDTAQGPGRLIAFEFNTDQVYLLAFTEARIDVYKDGARAARIAAPWTAAQIAKIVWVQSADTLLVVHPDVPPKKITRASHASWALADWVFAGGPSGERIRQPFHKFAAADTTLRASATSGGVTLSASADAFQPGHAGARFRMQNRELEITAVVSATRARARVREPLASASATRDFEEQAFSAARGWPASCCFHQDRLVIGGSRDLPNRLWLSRSSDLFNFDLGEGLDDEGIEFAILSDQVNAIGAVFSGRHLQIFTSGAEWMASGEPLTPSNIQLNRQTRIGSPVGRTVPPRDVDGATLFVSRSGRELREFIFADIEQAYQARDVAAAAGHLVNAPVDADYDTPGRLLYLVMGDGTLGTVTMYRSEQVTAWSLQETAGAFLSVALAGGDVYVMVRRAGGVFIERFDAALNVDAALSGRADAPKAVWTGLGHLDGETVRVAADGADRGPAAVRRGAVKLEYAATGVDIGLPFSHTVEPLPPHVATDGGGTQGGKVRLVSATLRLLDTAALHMDTGKGLVEAPFKTFGGGLLDSAPARFTGDKLVRAFGWRRDAAAPLWRIEQDTPLPFHLLSVTTHISVNG